MARLGEERSEGIGCRAWRPSPVERPPVLYRRHRCVSKLLAKQPGKRERVEHHPAVPWREVPGSWRPSCVAVALRTGNRCLAIAGSSLEEKATRLRPKQQLTLRTVRHASLLKAPHHSQISASPNANEPAVGRVRHRLVPPILRFPLPDYAPEAIDVQQRATAPKELSVSSDQVQLDTEGRMR